MKNTPYIDSLKSQMKPHELYLGRLPNNCTDLFDAETVAYELLEDWKQVMRDETEFQMNEVFQVGHIYTETEFIAKCDAVFTVQGRFAMAWAEMQKPAFSALDPQALGNINSYCQHFDEFITDVLVDLL